MRGLLLLLLLNPGMVTTHGSEPAGSSEYQVKAAFIYNFTLFVEWPEFSASERKFDIGILGSDPFGDLLDATVADGRVNGRPIVISRSSEPESLSHCRLVFVAHCSGEEMASALRALKRPGLLTVGEQPEFAQQGGVIEFVTLDHEVKFTINMTAAREARLEVSSRLQKIADSVLYGD